jgi:hypothetical protein
MKLFGNAHRATRRAGSFALAASAAGAAFVAGGPVLAGEPWLMLEGIEACRIGDFGCGHGFGCPCHLVPPLPTAH